MCVNGSARLHILASDSGVHNVAGLAGIVQRPIAAFQDIRLRALRSYLHPDSDFLLQRDVRDPIASHRILTLPADPAPRPSSRHPPRQRGGSVIYCQLYNPYRLAFSIADLRQALIERCGTSSARAVHPRVRITEIMGDVADKCGAAHPLQGYRLLRGGEFFSAEASHLRARGRRRASCGRRRPRGADSAAGGLCIVVSFLRLCMCCWRASTVQAMSTLENSNVVFVPTR
ncbi:hypothetical protein C8J57DRAFT_1521750 [Mycena rebaudengoi]|nr:hypothetical protein C8J57DRAFT_1521750 [Mycena rebaudengoi]